MNTALALGGRLHLIDEQVTRGSLSHWERDGVRGFGAKKLSAAGPPHPDPLPNGEREKTRRWVSFFNIF